VLVLVATLLACAQGFGAAGMPGDPGPVVLLGGSADAREVPELRELWDERVRIAIGKASEADPAPEATIVLARGERFAADDTRAARLVRAARAVELEPAPLIEWFDALYPGKHETELVRALREAQLNGCAVAGRGESVALLSAASVVDDARDVRRVERDPHDVGRASVVWGLGLQPWAVADEASRSGGSLERLLAVLEGDRMRLGLWVGEQSAVVIERDGGAFVARGAGVSAVLDPRGSRSRDGSLRDVGLSLLGPGDRWIRRERRADIASARPAALARERATLEIEHEAPLTLAALVGALESAAEPGPAAISLRGDGRVARIELGSHALRRAATAERAGGWSGLVTSFSWPRGRSAPDAGR
jgi:hypothetical protein